MAKLDLAKYEKNYFKKYEENGHCRNNQAERSLLSGNGIMGEQILGKPNPHIKNSDVDLETLRKNRAMGTVTQLKDKRGDLYCIKANDLIN
ncbi:MAG: hypothetical protein ACOWWO_09125 [Peptococcaceae bacterium]